MKNDFLKWILKRKHLLIFITLLFISFITIFVSRPYYQKQISSVGVYITSLFQRGAQETTQLISSTELSFLSKSQLIKRIQNLEADIEKLNNQIASRPNIEHFTFLDQQVKNHNLITQGFIPQPALIMARQVLSSGNSYLLSKGSSSGIKKNDCVVAIQDGKVYLAGRIYSTTPYSSIFWPVFHQNSHIAVRLSDSRYEGILQGGGSYTSDLELTRVDNSAEETIDYDDEVITSGLNSIYPPGILIGTVSKMERNVEAPSLKISVRASLDFQKTETLYVLTSEGENE